MALELQIDFVNYVAMIVLIAGTLCAFTVKPVNPFIIVARLMMLVAGCMLFAYGITNEQWVTQLVSSCCVVVNVAALYEIFN